MECWAIRSVPKVENKGTQLFGLGFSPKTSYGDHSYLDIIIFCPLRLPANSNSKNPSHMGPQTKPPEAK